MICLYRNILVVIVLLTVITTNVYSNNNNHNVRFGIRIHANQMNKNTFQKYYDGKIPVVIKDLFNFNHDTWLNQIFHILNNRTIEYDVRQYNLHDKEAIVSSYEASFNEYIDSLYENSDHNDSMYFMDEKILQTIPDEYIKAITISPTTTTSNTNTSSLLSSSTTSTNYIYENHRDLFELFPNDIQPHAALIIGGKGSRSFLHKDPYEWTLYYTIIYCYILLYSIVNIIIYY